MLSQLPDLFREALWIDFIIANPERFQLLPRGFNLGLNGFRLRLQFSRLLRLLSCLLRCQLFLVTDLSGEFISLLCQLTKLFDKLRCFSRFWFRDFELVETLPGDFDFRLERFRL